MSILIFLGGRGNGESSRGIRSVGEMEVGFDELMCVWLCLSGCFTFSVVTWSYLECLQ